MAVDFLGKELNVGDFVVTMYGYQGKSLTLREVINIIQRNSGEYLQIRRAGKPSKAEPMVRLPRQVLKISPEDALLYKLQQ